MSERTTISLSKNNYDRLKQIGKFGESFDDIISRVLLKESN
jgi:predicted CopG family antitoxin